MVPMVRVFMRPPIRATLRGCRCAEPCATPPAIWRAACVDRRLSNRLRATMLGFSLRSGNGERPGRPPASSAGAACRP